MAKKRQMRGSEEGAHLLAWIRVTFLKGDLRPRILPVPLKTVVKDIVFEWKDDKILNAA